MAGLCGEGAAVMSVLREVEGGLRPQGLPSRRLRDPLAGFPAVARILTLGKAAPGLAHAAARAFGSLPGLSYGVKGSEAPPAGWARLEGDHPSPSPGNAERTAEVRRWLEAGEGPLLVLISGGTSALLVEPAPPWSLSEKAVLLSELLRRGASIGEVNTVRVRLSRVKGGGLLSSTGGWPAATGIWSDVAAGSEEMVGSGPTLAWSTGRTAEAVLDRYGLRPPRPLPGPSPRRRAPAGPVFVLARALDLRKNLVLRLKAEGFSVAEVAVPEGRPAEDLAEALAERWHPSGGAGRRRALVGAGEAPVAAPEGGGAGGRCSHLAAAVALALRRRRKGLWAFAALATDGADGNGDGGAFTCFRCAPPSPLLEEALRAGNTAFLWRRAGGTVPRQPTGNNLRDLWALVETEGP